MWIAWMKNCFVAGLVVTAACLSAVPCLAVDKKPVQIDQPARPLAEARPAGSEYQEAGLWASFIRGNRFNMFTESNSEKYRASLILSLREDGATNMRISIWSATRPPEDFPRKSEVLVNAGGKSMALESQNDIETRLMGYGYVFNLVSASPYALSEIRKLMLANKMISLLIGNDEFEIKFSMNGFSAVVSRANSWFYGRNAS